MKSLFSGRIRLVLRFLTAANWLRFVGWIKFQTSVSQWTVSLGEGASICTVLQRRRREQLAVLAVATRSGTCMQVVGAFGAALLSGSILQSLVVHCPGAGREPGFSRKRSRVGLSHLAHGQGPVVLSITAPVKKRRNCLSSDKSSWWADERMAALRSLRCPSFESVGL